MMNNLLLERSNLFAKYAENMPGKPDKLELQLDYPDSGWIDMHFRVNDEEKIMKMHLKCITQKAISNE